MVKDKIISALAVNYLNVYQIDVLHNTAQVIKMHGYVFGGLDKNPNIINYEDTLELYAKNRVHSDDYEAFINNLSCKNLMNVLEHDNQFEYLYKIYEDLEEHFYSANYIKISEPEEPLVVVAGFRCIDNIYQEQNKKINEGISKAYEAISSIYRSMYRIDVTQNRYKEIKTTRLIKSLTSKSDGNFDEFIFKVMPKLIDDKYLDYVLDMLDFNQFEERLKDKSYITFEFLSKYAGWCRSRIIKEDVTNEGKLKHVIYTVEVIDDAVRREERLNQMAQTDYLTGLLNRGFGEKYVINKLNNKEEGLFMIIDCDKFKSINDTFGHSVGDIVLKNIASSIFGACEKNDIVFRLGGDEFAVYACGVCTEEAAKVLVNKIINNITTLNIEEIKGTKLYLSFGATFFNNTDIDFNNLYKQADNAMYESKKEEGFTLTFK